MRYFTLVRDSDESGVSGTGHIAWAVEFPHGLVAVSFRDDGPDGPGVRSMYWYLSLEDAERIHGHGGKTRFVEVGSRWPDGVPPTSYVRGKQHLSMDDMENVPAASIRGGRSFGATGYGDEWMAGYLDAGRRKYGVDWRGPDAFADAPTPGPEPVSLEELAYQRRNARYLKDMGRTFPYAFAGAPTPGPEK